VWELFDKVSRRYLPPREYANGWNQEKIVEDIVETFRDRERVNYVLGLAPGKGKSAIAINVAYYMNAKTVIVVPRRYLQRQYYVDFDAHEGRFRVGNITVGFLWGRARHRCLLRNVMCDEAPCAQGKWFGLFAKLRECPFYCPPLPKYVFEKLPQYNIDVEEVGTYINIFGTKYVVYRRSRGMCPYYEQWKNYVEKDVVVLNADLWRLEKKLGRLVGAEVEIIDEFDEIWNKFSPKFYVKYTDILNTLSKLREKLREVREQLKFSNDIEIFEKINELSQKISVVKSYVKRLRDLDDVIKFVDAYNEVIVDAQAILGEDIVHDPDIENLLNTLAMVRETVTTNYSDVEFVKSSFGFSIVCAIPAKFYSRTLLFNKAKRLFMSGTVPDPQILRSYYGIDADKVVIVDLKVPGKVYLGGTFGMVVRGKRFEVDVNHKRQYKQELIKTVYLARSEVKPRLVVITAYKYVDVVKNSLDILLDDSGALIEKLRRGEVEEVWTTRADRGADLPNVHGIIVTKMPYPDKSSPEWRALYRKNPPLARALYTFVAKAKLLQIISRALRSDDCWVVVYSPDEEIKFALEEFARKGIIELHTHEEFMREFNVNPYVKIKLKDELMGLGKAGDIVEVPRAYAEQLVRMNFAEYVGEEEENEEVEVMFTQDYEVEGRKYAKGQIAKLPMRLVRELKEKGIVILSEEES